MLRKVKRHLKWWLQRRSRGFDDRELWNLDSTIVDFLISRFLAFSNYVHSHPCDMTHDEWRNKLQSVVDTLLIFKNKDYDLYLLTEDQITNIKETFTWIGDNLFDLWD